jgi:molecular chaperone DnaK
MPRAVGIDLGTTNSLIAYVETARPEIIPNRSGDRMTPSVVGIDRQGQLIVGAGARRQLTVAPDRTIGEVKRLMGSGQSVTLGDRSYSPTEISAVILRSLADDAERFFGERLDEAVITVPAYFTDAQRQATKDAGELAGLRVERILNEPTAAALAYGLDHLDKEQHVVVYDLGGGTLDVSVLEMFEGVLDVKASSGNNRLGGSDFDAAVVEWLCAGAVRDLGVDVRADTRAMARLKAAAEQARCELSATATTTILVPALASRAGASVDLEVELTRRQLDGLLAPLVRSTLEPLKAALVDARLDPKAIAEVVLVGGASRTPLVRTMVAEFFGREARHGVHPDEAVALGAAMQAALKTGAVSAHHGIMITDVAPFTLGVEVQSSAGRQRLDGMFSPIITRNCTIPVSRTEVYSTTVDRQRQVDIKIYQGESRLVRSNTFLDQYTVDGIPPGPSGAEKVAVTFTYDVNGILKVSTRIVSTGKEAVLVVDRSPQRLSDSERSSARERLAREWAVRAPAPAGPGMSVAPPSAAVSAAASPITRPVGDDAHAEVADLLAAARLRLPRLAPEARERVSGLIVQIEAAVARRDAGAVSALDVALTDTLFELDE